MTTDAMRRMMLCGTQGRDDRAFRSRHMGREFAQEFTLYGRRKHRDAIHDELIRLVRLPLFDEASRVMDPPPVEDTRLTPGDTRVLDEFLNSFSRT